MKLGSLALYSCLAGRKQSWLKARSWSFSLAAVILKQAEKAAGMVDEEAVGRFCFLVAMKQLRLWVKGRDLCGARTPISAAGSLAHEPFLSCGVLGVGESIVFRLVLGSFSSLNLVGRCQVLPLPSKGTGTQTPEAGSWLFVGVSLLLL